jgi:hypothetical protein
METSRGTKLAQDIRQKIDELKKVCEGVDEKTASRAPSERWSPKQILSHLWGKGEAGRMAMLRSFLDEDTPTVDLDPGNPYFSDERAQMTFARLLSEVQREYEGLSRFAEGLTDEELDRKAHAPQLKDSPMGEYPTLEAMVGLLGARHVKHHTDHMREILEALSGG